MSILHAHAAKAVFIALVFAIKFMESLPASTGNMLAGVMLCLPGEVNGKELMDKCVREEHLKICA